MNHDAAQDAAPSPEAVAKDQGDATPSARRPYVKPELRRQGSLQPSLLGSPPPPP